MVASTFVLILKTALYVTAKRVTPLTKTKKHAMVIVFYVVCHETISSNVSTNMVYNALFKVHRKVYLCHLQNTYVIYHAIWICLASHSAHGRGIILSSGNNLCTVDIRVITGVRPNATCLLAWTSNITHIAVAANDSKVIFAAGDELILYDLVTKQNTSLVSTGKVSGNIKSYTFWCDID